LANKLGVLQAMYNQLCRLSWALGAPIVGPVVQVMSERGLLEKLEPGPFGNCQST
jgi:hypothetical protein